ncbi:MAG: L-histidine N(alpha)-methyltransferase [bacterium]|nr:L-histidine N(alpha)-methyltransferase [bacterium]
MAEEMEEHIAGGHPTSLDLAALLRTLPSATQTESELRLQFATDVDAGLSAPARSLDCQYLYDARGSELFEEICEQPEYYPTRTEEAILSAQAERIAALTGPLTIMEFGAGTSRKTHHLLRAYRDLDASPRYLAVDVSPSALEKGRQSIERDLPAVEFFAAPSTYHDSFEVVPHLGTTMMVFLGSTIGNFSDSSFSDFFETAARHLPKGDYFLLGADLHKDTETLEAAYNDAAGVTAAFTRNLFTRLNRELGSSIDIDAVEHRAHYNAEAQQIEIYAEFVTAQEIYLAPLGIRHQVKAGECIHTEISRKFCLDPLEERLLKTGFGVKEVFTDPRSWFAVLLLERL